jgi:hypothetical protein
VFQGNEDPAVFPVSREQGARVSVRKRREAARPSLFNSEFAAKAEQASKKRRTLQVNFSARCGL